MAPTWRIDELAQRAGVTVDTIRYYAREQLLPPPERAGRHKLYGPEHLDRLTQIRDLQAQRFSLAAIRAVLDADRPGLERLFGGDNRRQLSLAELVEESGVNPEIVDGLRQVGLLPDPAEFGAEAYDDADLGVLKAVAELQAVGMPPEILVELGAIYVRHFRALQHDVHDMLSGKTRADWDPAELVVDPATAHREHVTHDPGHRPGAQLRAPAHDPTPHVGSAEDRSRNPHRGRRRACRRRTDPT